MAVGIGAIVVIAIVLSLLTVLYGDNPVSRTAQAVFMGVQAGYLLLTNLDFYYRKGIVRMTMPGELHYIIPVILGILVYARLHERTRYLYRYPMAILVGSMLGVSMRTTVFSQIIDQLKGNFPPSAPLVGVPVGTAVNNLIIILGTLFALVFFVFSREFKGPERYVHRIGRLFLLAAFGGTYGNTVSYRYELMAGTFISNLLTPAEILPYTGAIALIIAVILVISFKQGYAEW
jgi:hypothetical protein